MRLSTATTITLASGFASALTTPGAVQLPRAAPDAPSGGYAPAMVDCLKDSPKVREGTSLSKQEKDWLEKRDSKTRPAVAKFLQRVKVSDFDSEAYLKKDDAYPRVSIAISGGGYRALMNGAGFIQAADSRTAGDGGISGLLEATTYLSGLSGGGWLVGSIYGNNYTTIDDLLASEEVWQFQDSILSGPPTPDDTIGVLDTASYWKALYREVQSKKDAGYEISLTDFWGRAVSYQLLEGAKGGLGYTYSSFADDATFKNGDSPFPILVADGRAPGTKVISLNSTVFEFNPFEMGSWDPTLNAFVPIKYLGSNFDGGEIANGTCTRGFDALSFVMGTSSSLFNMMLQTELPDSIPSSIQDTIQSLITTIDEENNDIAQYKPNPFKNYRPKEVTLASSDSLDLVDGGLDLQNIPLQPVLQPSRGVDVIFAIDSSADTNNWPNGTALRATYDRSLTDIASGVTFPPVPPANTFINLGLNRAPTFFGCSASNFSSDAAIPPLVVYMPNEPLTTFSNVSTFDRTHEIKVRNAIVRNGFQAAKRDRLDDKWPTCVACAVMSRSFDRTGTEPPAACKQCFDRYCWDGKLDETPVLKYEPELTFPGEAESESAGSRTSLGGVLGLAAMAAGYAFLL